MGSIEPERKAVASVPVNRKELAEIYFLLTPQALIKCGPDELKEVS